MALRDNFKVGDKVRPSREGMRCGLWSPGRQPKVGTVTAKSQDPDLVCVTWAGRKTYYRYHKDFVSRTTKEG